MLCLGIESSCDETALALVCDGQLRDAVLATQMDVHALFGGVVPELASREHYRFMGALYDALMERNGLTAADLDVIAVSRGPGLLGSLLVGTAFAKALALGSGARLLGINHLHAHLLAVGLREPVPFPALGLLVSGGHTHLYHMTAPASFLPLGRTLDDAAGEAFDKVAKLLGLPYPGGRLLDKLACAGTPRAGLFPCPYVDNTNLDFSFSGLKTAFSQYLDAHPWLRDAVRSWDGTSAADAEVCDVCASFVAAVSATLCIKTARAWDRHGDLRTLIMAGGVAANRILRRDMAALAHKRGGRLLLPPPSLCTDNAAMVAYAGFLLAREGFTHDLGFETVPRGRVIPHDMRRSTAPGCGEGGGTRL